MPLGDHPGAPTQNSSNPTSLVTSDVAASSTYGQRPYDDVQLNMEPKMGGGSETAKFPSPLAVAAAAGSGDGDPLATLPSGGPSRVKLTRKCPYVVGPHIMSGSILKGTPKPVITRKPPLLLKDKPKIPLKPNNLLLRSPSPHSLSSSCSSSPSPTPSEQLEIPLSSAAGEPANKPDDGDAGTAAVMETTKTTTTTATSSSNKRSASLVRGRNPVAAPRTFSFRVTSEPASLREGEGLEAFMGWSSFENMILFLRIYI